MKILFDLLPVLFFFGAFKYASARPDEAAGLLGQFLGGVETAQAPILLATLVVIAATLGQILWVRLRHGHVDKMLWISLGLVTVFGGLTLFFRDETFIKWKPTLLYWIFAISLAFSQWVLKKNALRTMLGEQITLPDPLWAKLAVAWMAFFTAMGFLNLGVAYYFPTDIWVDFKLFGGMGLLFVFIMAQGVVLSRHLEDKN